MEDSMTRSSETVKGYSRVSLLVIFLVRVSVSEGQLPTAAIWGIVKASNGAVVQGAKVTAQNVETSQTREAATTDDGS